MKIPEYRLPFVAALLTASSLLAGCLAVASKITAAEKPSLGRVAVTSMLGTRFQMIYVGVTVFGNTSTAENASDWRADDVVGDAVVGALSKSGFRDAVNLPFAGIAGKLPLGTGSKEERDAALLAARQSGIGTLIMVRYIGSENEPFLNSGNYGIFSRGKRTCVFSKFFVTIYRVSDSSERKGSFQSDCTNDDSISWKPRLSDYSDEEISRIQAILLKQLRSQIIQALDSTGMTGVGS